MRSKKSTLLYFFGTLIILCVITLFKGKIDSVSLEKNYEKYEEITCNLVKINYSQYGYSAIISIDGEIVGEVRLTDDEASEYFDKMGFDQDNVNRDKSIDIVVKTNGKGKYFSHKDYEDAINHVNPDKLYYTIIIVVALLSFGRVAISSNNSKI